MSTADHIAQAIAKQENSSGPISNGKMAVGAKELARLLDISLRSIRRLDASGRLPRGYMLGGSKRWNLDEISRWLDSGCLSRAAWERLKKEAS